MLGNAERRDVRVARHLRRALVAVGKCVGRENVGRIRRARFGAELAATRDTASRVEITAA